MTNSDILDLNKFWKGEIMKRNKKRIAVETPCCMLAGSIQSMKISANDVATQEEIDVVVKNDGQAVKASDINTSIT